MSYQGDKKQLFEKHPEYQEVLSLQSPQDIYDCVEGLIEDHFDAKTCVIVPRTTFEEIVENMAVCSLNKSSASIEKDIKEAQAKEEFIKDGKLLKEERELVRKTIYNISQRLANKIEVEFSFKKDDAAIYRKFAPGSLRPYIDGWDMKTNLEFCISAKMSYENAMIFTKEMMGMPWLYLRNPEHLIGDYCLKFSLGPKEYYRLSKTFADLEKEVEWHKTECTMILAKRYSDLCMDMKEAMEAENPTKEALCEELELFAKMNKRYLFGHNQRARKRIRELITEHETELAFSEHYFGKVRLNKAKSEEMSFNKSKLAEHMAATSFPWESRRQEHLTRTGEDSLMNELFFSESNVKRSVKKRIEKYIDPQIGENSINYLQLRTDMIRLLLMNGWSDLQKINEELESYSFFPLDIHLPFDVLVLAVLLYDGKEIVSGQQSDDMYGKLEAFFKVYIAAEEDFFDEKELKKEARKEKILQEERKRREMQ